MYFTNFSFRPTTQIIFCNLVPISATEGIKMLYVFVDIKIDMIHFIDTVKHNIPEGSRLAMVSTVQFISSLQVTDAIVE